MADEDVVHYRATSAFTDPITIINFVSLALLSSDVRAIIPVKYMPYVAALLAVLNIILRSAPVGDRPVRVNIVPGDSKPVAMKKLE